MEAQPNGRRLCVPGTQAVLARAAARAEEDFVFQEHKRSFARLLWAAE
jgi:hypothetical protein